jgi:hypothetical protein
MESQERKIKQNKAKTRKKKTKNKKQKKERTSENGPNRLRMIRRLSRCLGCGPET